MQDEYDWLQAIGEAFTVEQEQHLIERCLRPECRVPIRWVGVSTSFQGHSGVFCVGADALGLAHPSGQVRVNVSSQGAQRLCDAMGLQMPTPLMIDRVWEQATLRLAPKTYTPDAQARVHVADRQGNSVTVSMMGLTAMLAHSDRIQAEIVGAADLVCNVGKWWVICKRIAGQPLHASFKAANYGWFDARGPNLSVTGKKVWQSLGTRHNQLHRDYSQTFVPVGRMMLVDGEPMSVADVLASPTLAGLISHEGPLPFARHPNQPAWMPSGGCVSLSPDPSEVPVVSGIVPEVDIPTKPNMQVMPSLVRSKNYTKAPTRPIDLVVIHTMEAPEKPGTARGVANWFASKNAPMASAHYCVDDRETIQCVEEHDIAWCAPGANHNGVHIEHAGYAAQSPTQWNDVYSLAMLERSSTLAARICERYLIAVVYVDAEGLLRGERGITTHAQVTRACSLAKQRAMTSSPFFKAKTTHTDPGPHFPMDAYLAAVGSKMEQMETP